MIFLKIWVTEVFILNVFAKYRPTENNRTCMLFSFNNQASKRVEHHGIRLDCNQYVLKVI